MSFFDMQTQNNAPLADRMRPQKLEDFCGQTHIVGKDKLLFRAIKTNTLSSCIFWGPPGTGKTSLAYIVANNANAHFEKLNAVTCGVAEIKKIAGEANERLSLYGQKTYLLLDECHRFSKTQSDSLLPHIESGRLIFIGSTTENPYVSMTSAIVSRCRVFEFVRLSEDDIVWGLKRAIADTQNGLGNFNVDIDEDAIRHWASFCNGDLRNALNALELAVLSTPMGADGKIKINLEIAENSIQQRTISLDENLFYDILSAFCKSLRGSDPNAALYYAERLMCSGCDPRVVARRLIAHSAEDVGLADPHAMPLAVAALTCVEKLGLPECRIPLAEAIIYVCKAKKSNSVVVALDSANEDAKFHADDNVPKYLRDSSYKGSENRVEAGYKYPHDFGGYVEQQYLPDSLKDKKYYRPSGKGEDK